MAERNSRTRRATVATRKNARVIDDKNTSKIHEASRPLMDFSDEFPERREGGGMEVIYIEHPPKAAEFAPLRGTNSRVILGPVDIISRGVGDAPLFLPSEIYICSRPVCAR